MVTAASAISAVPANTAEALRDLQDRLGRFARTICVISGVMLAASVTNALTVGGDAAPISEVLGNLGVGAGLLVAVAALRNITTLVAPVAQINNVTLPLWLITLGVLFLRDGGRPRTV
jgi:hypothetical protein